MNAVTKWTDPFDDMSDEEFDEHVEALFAERPRNVAVSLRVPAVLLERLKDRRPEQVCPTRHSSSLSSNLPSLASRVVPSHRARAGQARAIGVLPRPNFRPRSPGSRYGTPPPMASLACRYLTKGRVGDLRAPLP